MQSPICLITPPSLFLADARVFASLGILRVAAVLERDGYIVEHLDLNGIDNYLDVVKVHAAQSKAQVFGLTATSPQMPATTRVVEAIRAVRPDAKVILGGPHVTLVNAGRKKEEKRGLVGRAHRAMNVLASQYDVLVAGDGEDAVFHALMPDAPKLIDADDAASALFMTNERYDEMPYPARHLIDFDSYHYTIDGVRSCSLLGQMGCPYKCTFCSGRNSPSLRRIRSRSVENIIGELRHLYSTYGVQGWMHYDDELNVSKLMIDFMDAMAALQEELGVEFKQRGFIKSNLFNEAQAEAMYRAGFRWILVGFESGSPRILENIQKQATREQNTACMRLAKKHGLKVKALMSLGHAGESAETIRETKEWLLEEQPEDFDATVITAYPGSPYFDDAVETAPNIWTYTAPKSGDRLHAYDVDFNHEELYYKGLLEEYHSYVYTDHLSADEIVSLRDELERDVRAKLGIPFNPSAPGVRFETSMGLTKLPPNMLRITDPRGKKSLRWESERDGMVRV
jgi:anaerobic magnesium-protoporphyrin IX monomethyl ester cyclase